MKSEVMKSVWFNWNDHCGKSIGSKEESPDFIIKSFSELPGLLSLI